MINAVGVPQSILVLGGTSEIGLAISAAFLEKGPAKVTLAALPGDPGREAAEAQMRAAGDVYASATSVMSPRPITTSARSRSGRCGDRAGTGAAAALLIRFSPWDQ